MNSESQQNDDRDVVETKLIEDALAGVRRRLEDAITGLGGYAVAGGVVKKDRSDLRKAVAAIDGENGTRVLSLEDLFRLARRVVRSNRQLATAIAADIARVFDMLVFPMVDLTVEQQNERMKGAFAALGPMGLAAMHQALNPSLR